MRGISVATDSNQRVTPSGKYLLADQHIEYLESGAAKHHAAKVAGGDTDRSYTFAELDRTQAMRPRLGSRLADQGQPVVCFLPRSGGCSLRIGYFNSGNFYMTSDGSSRAAHKGIGHITADLIVT